MAEIYRNKFEGKIETPKEGLIKILKELETGLSSEENIEAINQIFGNEERNQLLGKIEKYRSKVELEDKNPGKGSLVIDLLGNFRTELCSAVCRFVKKGDASKKEMIRDTLSLINDYFDMLDNAEFEEGEFASVENVEVWKNSGLNGKKYVSERKKHLEDTISKAAA